MENIINEKEQILKKIIFQKYKLIKSLSANSNNFVFEGINITNKVKVAVKLENKITGKNTLTRECYIIMILKNSGIPELVSFGHIGKYNVLIENLLGKSLQDLFELNDNEMPIEDICMIAIQILERIEFIHSKYIIHRNINPNNLLIGLKNSSLIYMIDFGNARKYRSSRSGKHLKFKLNQKIFGEISFISTNAMRGAEQSRKDDLESIGYTLIYLLKGFLPWKEFENKTDKLEKIYELKKKISLTRLCKYLPEEIKNYMEYCKDLSFEQEPNYDYLRGLFKQILSKMQKINDNIFFWNKNKNEDNKKNKIDLFKRKESPFTRLFKKINTSLNKNKNLITIDSTNRNISNKKMKTSKTQLDIFSCEGIYKTEHQDKGKNCIYNSITNNHLYNNKSLFNGKNFIYKKKINISPNYSHSKKKTEQKANLNIEVIDIDIGNNILLNNNSMENYNVSDFTDLSIINPKDEKRHNIFIKKNNFKSIKINNDNNIYRNNISPESSIYTNKIRNIKSKINNNINYNNQNYIDNINIIGYLKNYNNNTLNNSIEHNLKYNNILNNSIINKNKDININQNFKTQRNNLKLNNINNIFNPISDRNISKSNILLTDVFDDLNKNDYSTNRKKINKKLISKYLNNKNIKKKPFSNNKYFHINRIYNDDINYSNNINNISHSNMIKNYIEFKNLNMENKLTKNHSSKYNNIGTIYIKKK